MKKSAYKKPASLAGDPPGQRRPAGKHRREKQEQADAVIATQALIQELQANQVELEIQNDELRHTQQEAETLWHNYHALYDFAPIGFLALNAAGRIQKANQMTATLLGMAQSKLLNRPFRTFIAPGAHAEFNAYCARAWETNDKQTHEFPLLKQDGVSMYAKLESAVIASSEKETSLLQIAILDITERKQAEMALRESKDRLSFALAASRVGVWEWNIQTNEVYWSRECYEMLGVESFGGNLESFAALVHPEDKARVLESAVQAMNNRTEYSVEFRVVCPDGSVRWIVDHAQGSYDKDGAPLRMIGIAQDITEQKHAGQQLAAQYAVSRALAESASLSLAVPAVLRAIGETLQWEFGAFWRVDREANVLRCGATWRSDSMMTTEFEAITQQSHLEPGVGLPGQVWVNGKTLWVSDILAETDRIAVQRRRSVAEAGLRSALVFPISVEKEILGIVEFFSRDMRFADHRLFQMVTALGSQIGQFIERKMMEEELSARECQRTQIARAQTSALIQTLQALKPGLDQEAFLGQVLITMTDYLHAVSAALWFYDEAQDVLSLYMIHEQGRIFSGDNIDHPVASVALASARNPFWAQLLRTRYPLLVNLSTEETHLLEREWLLEKGVTNLLLVPLLLGEEALGWISLRYNQPRHYQQEELELAQALAQQVTLAMQLIRLVEHRQQAAVLRERNRLAQDIHDTLAQGFTGILLQLEAAMHAPAPELTRRHIEQARDLARENLQEARRSVRALRPLALDNENLVGALTHCIHQMTSYGTTPVQFAVHGIPCPLPAELEDDLFRIGQEALTNALKHAEADEIHLDLTFGPAQMQLDVRDNGKGFDVYGGFQGNGFGLIGMHERAERLGGQLRIFSLPGQGTSVTVVVPIPSVRRQGGSRP